MENKQYKLREIPVSVFIEYELMNSRWASFAFTKWLRDFAAKYYTNKALKKLKRAKSEMTFDGVTINIIHTCE